MLRRMVVLSTLAIASSGCLSLVAVDGPPRLRPGAPLPDHADCTRSMAAPGIDLLIGAVSGGLVFFHRVTRAHLSAEARTFDGIVEVPALVISAVGVLSGTLGYRRVEACRDFAEMISAADTTAMGPPRFFGAGAVIDSPLPPWAVRDDRTVTGWFRPDSGPSNHTASPGSEHGAVSGRSGSSIADAGGHMRVPPSRRCPPNLGRRESAALTSALTSGGRTR